MSDASAASPLAGFEKTDPLRRQCAKQIARPPLQDRMDPAGRHVQQWAQDEGPKMGARMRQDWIGLGSDAGPGLAHRDDVEVQRACGVAFARTRPARASMPCSQLRTAAESGSMSVAARRATALT